MISIEGNRVALYQWDLNQRVILLNISSGTEIHFSDSNSAEESCAVLKTYTEKGQMYADIPNILLQKSGTIYAYVYIKNKDRSYTIHKSEIIVLPRKKPADYVYEETEILNFKTVVNKALEEAKIKGDFKGDKGYTPQKGVDYFTQLEKDELVEDVFGVLKEMSAFDVVNFTKNTKVTLSPGRMYFFESAGDSYKVQLYDQDGNVQSQIEESIGGIILYPSKGVAKYMSIKEKPSSIGLSDLLNFRGLFDKFIQTTIFNVNTEKPYIYLEATDKQNVLCWEITGRSCDLQIGTYAMKQLIEGITAELSVSFFYPLEFDEYAIAIDGVEIDRQIYGGTMRVAAELLKSKETQIVFYRNGEEVIKARVHPTILNCGILYAIER